jgi:peptidoglycan/LPS O-acetylase OafA/YrhL
VGFLAVAAISLPLPKTGLPPFTGGWNLPALAYALWEQLTGIALALGAMSLCARRLPATTPWSTWLADRSFAVYVLHSPILVALALTLQPLNASPFLMAFLLTFIGLALSFAAADLARRIPVVRAIS